MAIKHMKKILNMEIWHKEPKFTLKKLGSLHKVLYAKQKKMKKKMQQKKERKPVDRRGLAEWVKNGRSPPY